MLVAKLETATSIDSNNEDNKGYVCLPLQQVAWATAPRRRLRRRSSRSPVATVAVPSSFKYSVPECALSPKLHTVIHIVKHDWALNANPSVFRRLILRLTKLDAYPLGRGTQNPLVFNVSQVNFKTNSASHTSVLCTSTL